MERLVQAERDRLQTLLRERFTQYMGRVMDAVNAAPDGKLIEGSEVEVHDLMRQFEQEVYQAALQARIDSTESSFSPSQAPIGADVREQGQVPQQPSDAAGPGGIVPQKVRGRGGKRHAGG